ncbi:hypothetical protein TB2_031525 [Malus domestica]|uniref:Uncharacterized protein n=1 Tax=Malus domestica TaxID=3750 RepID=A0A498JYE1_MALDO|nr:hypothetical protein DVH24_001133 [Malus domestica]
MGIVETLQYLEPSRRIASVNDSHSEGRLVRMPMANGECSIRTQSPKLKRRKISAVRDFPPGCGRFGQLSNLGPDKEAASVGTLLTALTESLVSGGKYGDGRGAENLMPSTGQVDDTVLISGNDVSTGETVESLTALEHEIYDSLKIQHQLGAAAPEEEIVAVLPDRNICSPPDRSISISKCNLLEKTAVKKYPPRRKISADRDLPPLCGRNASLEVRKFGQEKSLIDGEPSSLNTVKTDVKQTCEDIHDEEFHKSEYVENLLEISGSEVQPNCNGHVVQEMEREDEYKVNSKINVVLEGTRKTCIEPSQKRNGCLRTKDVQHSEEKVEDKMEVYQAEKSTSEKCLEVSYYNNQLHEEDFVSLEPTSNSEIVLGLMAASNCPWRKGKGVFKRKSEGSVSERKPSQQSNGCQGMGDIGLSEEIVGTEMVVYQAKKSPGKKCIDVSYYHNQLHKEVLGISERTMDRVVVLGLMAASNCPWRKGKEVSMRKPEDGASESKPSQESNGCQGIGGVGHSEEIVGKEMVVYQAKRSPGEKCIDVSYYHNQLHKEVLGISERTMDRMVVLGLMAASNCPWRKGKEVSMRKPEDGASESKPSQESNGCQGMGGVGHSEEKVGKEMVVYQAKETLGETCLEVSYYNNQLHKEDFESSELTSDTVVVLGLMAASNCPWRKGKRVSKHKAKGGTSECEQNKLDLKCQLEGSSTVSTKVDSDIGRKSVKKIFRKARKSAYQGTSLFWDEEYSLEHDPEDLHVTPRSCYSDVSPHLFSPSSATSKNNENNAIVNRHTVKETLHLFQALCRKLLQEEEGKSKEGGISRQKIDYSALKILRDKGKYVNIGKHIGAVPGVEVGDEFHNRVELTIVGLHRLTQGGIDYVNHCGKILATSIIASGGYADDLNDSNSLIYTGQGGNVMKTNKEPEDQKLERGNLALDNSLHERNPVRVIRGSESSDGKSKTYVYDGLYLVKKRWQELGSHGKLVFKFQLDKIRDQDLARKEVKKSKIIQVQEGLCIDDISLGKELIPVSAVNTIDDEKPPTFVYVTSMLYPDWCRPIPLKGCSCIVECSDSEKCSCAVQNGGEIPYNFDGAIVEVKPLVYECGPSCKCPPSCYNRVSQHGIKFQLQIFKTESRGWGLRSLNYIPSGSFICEYMGELLEEDKAEERIGYDEYLFDIGNNYNDNNLWDELSTLVPDALSSSFEVVDDGKFTIDAANYGNVGRFINHSCSPNLYAQDVLYDHNDNRIPHIMFFAAEDIPPMQELTYHYNYTIDSVYDSNGNIKKKNCYCGSLDCTGRLY